MKRNQIVLILIVVLGALAVFFVVRNKPSTIKKELRDFAIEDTASIDRIFMVEKDLDQVTLTRDRENNRWVVNGKYTARPEAIDILLKTLKRIRVKSPVSKAAFDNAVTMLATRNTKVEVFSGKKLIKTLYVGGPTQDQMGTFMMLEGSSAPFVVHIPGFVGYLSTRFFTTEREWRSQILFQSDFQGLAQVEVINNEEPDQSFQIQKSTEGTLSLKRLSDQTSPSALDTAAVNYYLSSYEKIPMEFFIEGMSPQLLDSLKSATPMRVVRVADHKGQQLEVQLHRRYANGKLDTDGNPLVFDDERMYGLVNRSEWMVVQYYVFGKMFRDYRDFEANTP